MSIHERHPRKGLVASWPIFTEPMPSGALISMATCGCPRHIAYCKGQATRMGLTGTFYLDEDNR